MIYIKILYNLNFNNCFNKFIDTYNLIKIFIQILNKMKKTLIFKLI